MFSRFRKLFSGKAPETVIEEADAKEADVTEVDVTEADATEADVTEADATEADATEADVTEADVTEADATEADATEADATEADAEQIICSICLDPVIGPRNCCMTDCGHSFHTSCMLRTNGTCPNCRTELRRPESANPESANHENVNPENAEIINYLEMVNRVIDEYRPIYRMAVREPLEIIHIHYSAEETPSNIGNRAVIDQFWNALESNNVPELTRIAESYYTSPADPEYPSRRISWELYNAFTTYIERME